MRTNWEYLKTVVRSSFEDLRKVANGDVPDKYLEAYPKCAQALEDTGRVARVFVDVSKATQLGHVIDCIKKMEKADVTACSSHDGLVSALENLIKAIELNIHIDKGSMSHLDAKTALDAVKKG